MNITSSQQRAQLIADGSILYNKTPHRELWAIVSDNKFIGTRCFEAKVTPTAEAIAAFNNTEANKRLNAKWYCNGKFY
jgi:hypothetical protein